MMPTPTEIQYFIETYQALHVSRAALRLGITQPTLTQSLQKLESKFGTPLFLRTKQGVIPTKEGTLFYAKAQALLESWIEVSTAVQKSRTEIQGRFRIGCHPSVGAYTMPVLFKKLEQSAPRIEIDLIHDFSRRITEMLVSYQVDLGFVVNPVRHPDLVLRKLGQDRVMFWKKRGQSSIPKRLFADAGLNHAQTETLLGKTYKKYFSDWSLVRSSSLELIRTMTLSGQGIGIIPERVAKADLQDLIEFDKNLPIFHDEIYLAYRRDLQSSAAGKVLATLAQITI